MADPSLDHRIGSSTLGASLNLAKLCIGSGILALPFATAKGGLLVSPLIMATIAVWNGWACSLMMECKNAVVDRSLSLPTASTYSRIALAGLGKVGMAVTDVSVVLTLLGVCVAYQITFASLVHDLLGPIPALSLPSLALASGLLAFPLSCAGDVGALSWLSLAGLLCLCVGVMAILSSGLQVFGWETWQHPLLSSVTGEQLSLFPESSSALAAFIGITTFCFGLCSLAFPVEESMEHKADFPIAVRWSLLAVWLMYVLLGDGAALLYLHHPQGISGNILSDLPRSSVAAALVKLSMASMCVLTFPLTFVPAAQMLEQMLAEGSNGYRPISGDDKLPIASEGAIPRWLFLGRRLLLVMGCTVVASIVPCFAMVISLLGGCTVALLSFILPPLLHLRLVAGPALRAQAGERDEESQRAPSLLTLKLTCVLDVVLTGCGVLLSALATGTIIADCIGRFQAGLACR